MNVRKKEKFSNYNRKWTPHIGDVIFPLTQKVSPPRYTLQSLHGDKPKTHPRGSSQFSLHRELDGEPH